jgi:hypothetical protein
MGWYPRRVQYYRPVAGSEEVEQGDIFWGVPNVLAAHPAVADAFHAPGEVPAPEDLDPPLLSEVLRGILITADPVIVVPHTCDFYGPEKGRNHRERLVATIQPLRGSPVEEPDLLRSGEGYGHTFFLPDWKTPHRAEADRFVNFRLMTTVDASYLSQRRRLARLSAPAVIALRRRLASFFTDYAPMPSELVEADQRGGLIRSNRDLLARHELEELGPPALEMIRALLDPRRPARPGDAPTAETSQLEPKG